MGEKDGDVGVDWGEGGYDSDNGAIGGHNRNDMGVKRGHEEEDRRRVIWVSKRGYEDVM